MLFNKLPDEIFKPLAGANRYLFEEILLFLFRYFSDEDLTNEAVFPRRGHVVREIEELLERKGRLLQLFDEEGDAEEDFSNPGLAARYIYKRLVDTGWLEEEEDGYHTNVLMPPHASLLLEALEGVAHSEKKNYGSTIASIHLQLEAIANQPAANAHAFIEVVRAARDFTRHLQIGAARCHPDGTDRRQQEPTGSEPRQQRTVVPQAVGVRAGRYVRPEETGTGNEDQTAREGQLLPRAELS